MSPGINICPHCGMALAQEIRYCLYCHTKIPDKEKEEEE